MEISFRHFGQFKNGVDGPGFNSRAIIYDAATTEKVHIDTKLVTETIVKPQLCT